MAVKYCPQCSKEIPTKWIKEYELLLMPDTVGMTEIHCFNCETDFEIANKTVRDKRINQYYKDLGTENAMLFKQIMQKK